MLLVRLSSKTNTESHKNGNNCIYCLSNYLCELSQMVECSEGIELLQCQNQSLMRRGVHEVKMNEVVDTCRHKSITLKLKTT